MREVKWKGRNGPVCHFIYSKAEADTFGLEYKENWRDGRLGDWVLTDDGHVVQILRQASDKAGRFTLGTATMTIACASKKAVLDVTEKEDRYQLNGKRRDQRKLRPKELNAAMRVFCLHIAAGKDPEEAYKLAYNRATDIKTIRKGAKALLEVEAVQEEIRSKLGDLLEKEGITMSWILQQYKRIIMYGDKDAPKVVALNKLSQFQGMEKMIEKQEPLPELPAGVLSRYEVTGSEVIEDNAVKVSNESEETNEKAEVDDDLNFGVADSSSDGANA